LPTPIFHAPVVSFPHPDAANAPQGGRQILVRKPASRNPPCRLTPSCRLAITCPGGIEGRASRAPPDGYTILYGGISWNVLNAAFYSLSYDVLKDFTPISQLVKYSYVLFARKTMPAKDLNELIVWLKANPNKAAAAITTVAYRLINVFFQNQTGTRSPAAGPTTHPVRVRGSRHR
jgi:hypothetical protein